MPKITPKNVPLAGTEKQPLPGASARGKVDPQERIEVTVLVRPRVALSVRSVAFRNATAASLGRRQHLTREQWEQQYGSDPADFAQVEALAHEYELTVVHHSLAERRIVLSGTLDALTKAFPVRLQSATVLGQPCRIRTGAVRVPEALADIIEDVKGFDNRPQARAHFYRMPKPAAIRGKVRPRAGATAKTFTPVEVGKIYDFPTGADGAGQCIALIELGGGYRTADLKTYFKKLGLPTPSVTAVAVDKGHNAPGSDADGEVMLDIEVAAAIAPKAKIAVYFAPNTDQGFLDAIKTAVHDAKRKPSAVSISWGGPEDTFTAQSLKNYDAVFQEAAALGVTILVAAGDHGSSDVDPIDQQKRVDFPSASPWVLSCGGTRLETNASGGIASESAWNDGDGWATGGGVSLDFPLPDWQKGANVPKRDDQTAGRGVPDVAGNADGETGYQVRVDGQDQVIGGTSAVAPLWAGLVALLNQRLGKPVGFLNALLYGQAAARASFHDMTQGNNVAYQAGTGWDACTGLGSPDGGKLLAALQAPAPVMPSPTEPTTTTKPPPKPKGKKG